MYRVRHQESTQAEDKRPKAFEKIRKTEHKVWIKRSGHRGRKGRKCIY
jgi:hypothetical protein